MNEFDEECLNVFLENQSQLLRRQLQRRWKMQKHFWRTAWQLLWKTLMR